MSRTLQRSVQVSELFSFSQIHDDDDDDDDHDDDDDDDEGKLVQGWPTSSLFAQIVRP